MDVNFSLLVLPALSRLKITSQACQVQVALIETAAFPVTRCASTIFPEILSLDMEF